MWDGVGQSVLQGFGAGFALPWLSGSCSELEAAPRVCPTLLCVRCCAGGVRPILWSSTNPRLSLQAALSGAEGVWVPHLSVFVSFAQLPASFALTKQDGVYCLITEAAESGLVSRVIVVSAKKQN